MDALMTLVNLTGWSAGGRATYQNYALVIGMGDYTLLPRP